jgi:hypothetical protein
MRGPTHCLSKHLGIMSRGDCFQLKVSQHCHTYECATTGHLANNLERKEKRKMRYRPAKANRRKGRSE